MNERELEKAAHWMIDKGYATGHGDSIEDLLKELEWQVAERERNSCAALCSATAAGRDAEAIEEAIRARGEK